MILLVAGPSHTGKTRLALQLLKKTGYPCLSIDHLKMGLIRSNNTNLAPDSPDEKLTGYLWPIVREMIKTAIENRQNMIIEGCYIPSDWKDCFGPEYLENIRYLCLLMSENYIRTNFNTIKEYANVVENRIDDSFCTPDNLVRDNRMALEECGKHGLNFLMIDGKYPEEIGVECFA